MSPETLWIALAALLGLVVGSFLNVVALRLPARLWYRHRRECREDLGLVGEAEPPPPGLLWPPSHCPACGHRLRPRENVPVLSWLLQRGRCRACGAPVSARYPVVELAAAGLAVWAVLAAGPGPEAVALAGLGWTLLTLALIDLDHQLLPDGPTLGLLWAGLLLAVAGIGPAPTAAILGAAAGYGALWLVATGYRTLAGREGLGGGDLKLLAALGAWVGWQPLPLVVIAAAVPGAIIGLLLTAAGRDRHEPLPFGPFLALGGWLIALHGDRLARWLYGAPL
ncbi:MAG: prepilin peptidase [Thiohalospira sp.]